MLALSASTPIVHGKLADTDVRWATIAASVDDRTPQVPKILILKSDLKKSQSQKPSRKSTKPAFPE